MSIMVSSNIEKLGDQYSDHNNLINDISYENFNNLLNKNKNKNEIS